MGRTGFEICLIVAAVLICFFMMTGQARAAAEATHCITTGSRTVCYYTNSYTGVRVKVVTTRIRGIVDTRVTSNGYSAVERTITHGKTHVTTGSDSEGRRWAQHSLSSYSMSSIAADTGSIASDMSIAR